MNTARTAGRAFGASASALTAASPPIRRSASTATPAKITHPPHATTVRRRSVDSAIAPAISSTETTMMTMTSVFAVFSAFCAASILSVFSTCNCCRFAGRRSATPAGRPVPAATCAMRSWRLSVTVPPRATSPLRTFRSSRCAVRLAFSQATCAAALPSTFGALRLATSRRPAAIGPASGFRLGGSVSRSLVSTGALA